jgi:hypothetical protein
METKLVNCKVAFIRPKYKNLKEWIEDPDNVYIARAGVVFVDKVRYPKESSPFANPYKVGKHGTREEVVEKYKIYILEKIDSDPEFKKLVETLRGKTLGCWCSPELCHGNILLDILK